MSAHGKSPPPGVKTQQILAYETGVTNLADPLGGSYYVESLTDKMEEKALKIMKQVENLLMTLLI